MVVNSALIRPYFLGGGGGIGRIPLDSHDLTGVIMLPTQIMQTRICRGKVSLGKFEKVGYLA